ncbi:conserved hypothetical protein [Vibrio crassostreae]|nr:conserved hypothetical protein [Vibrio crassostreae]
MTFLQIFLALFLFKEKYYVRRYKQRSTRNRFNYYLARASPSYRI